MCFLLSYFLPVLFMINRTWTVYSMYPLEHQLNCYSCALGTAKSEIWIIRTSHGYVVHKSVRTSDVVMYCPCSSLALHDLLHVVTFILRLQLIGKGFPHQSHYTLQVRPLVQLARSWFRPWSGHWMDHFVTGTWTFHDAAAAVGQWV